MDASVRRSLRASEPSARLSKLYCSVRDQLAEVGDDRERYDQQAAANGNESPLPSKRFEQPREVPSRPARTNRRLGPGSSFYGIERWSQLDAGRVLPGLAR